jgi:MoaA/NifB/PqqE/SkfB family radical SAM enzyme
LTKQKFIDSGKLEMQIAQALWRGNDYIDFSGGEPTIHPDMPRLVKYCRSINMRCCIITNALCGVKTLDKLIDAGINDFLVSIHGTADTHNNIVGMADARDRQNRFLDRLHERGVSFRFNCVLNKGNEDELGEIVDYMLERRPRIVNFINMNPHGDWAGDMAGTRSVIADLRKIEPLLTSSVARLEAAGIGVNLRYYPMCRIGEAARKCVCNDLHVVFDPYEWDYEIQPKTMFKFRQWSVQTSHNLEHKGDPCKACDLQWICGGVNQAFHRASPDTASAVSAPDVNKTDAMYYRRHNALAFVVGGAA